MLLGQLNQIGVSLKSISTGMQSAFIDAHAEWVDVNRIQHAAVPAYGFYNLDWTKDGIYGKDLK